MEGTSRGLKGREELCWCELTLKGELARRFAEALASAAGLLPMEYRALIGRMVTPGSEIMDGSTKALKVSYEVLSGDVDRTSKSLSKFSLQCGLDWWRGGAGRTGVLAGRQCGPMGPWTLGSTGLL